jgi:hypothetical protein
MKIVILFASVTTVFLSAAGVGCSRTQRAGETQMSLSSSKETYVSGQQIVLPVTFHNQGKRACRVSTVPEAAVSIATVTRDGVQIEPAITTAEYIDGFANFLKANLSTIGPSGSISLSLTSGPRGVTGDRPALATYARQIDDEALVTLWPVDTPGRYVVTARYELPVLPNASADLCPATGASVPVSFVVSER